MRRLVGWYWGTAMSDKSSVIVTNAERVVAESSDLIAEVHKLTPGDVLTKVQQIIAETNALMTRMHRLIAWLDKAKEEGIKNLELPEF